MKILGLHTHHDASVCLLVDSILQFSIEAEKDSNPRFSKFMTERLERVLAQVTEVPDVVSVAGWHEGAYGNGGYPQTHPQGFTAKSPHNAKHCRGCT